MRIWRASVVPLLVLLAGCQVAAPPSRRSSLVILRGSHRSAFQAGREEQPSGAGVAVRWSFSTAAGECVAKTSGPSRSPALTVRVDHGAMRLALVPGGGASRLAFSGRGGSWTLRTARNGRSATATVPLDEAVTRLLALLDGGQLRLEAAARPAVLLLPDAGVSGRDWIGCVNGKMREARSTAER